MNVIKSELLQILVDTGRLPEGSSIDIESVVGDVGSDYRRVGLYATKKRCRKPFMYWNICIDIARGLVHWDTTTFCYL